MTWTGETSFETTDGSTTPTDGNPIVSTGDGTGWSGNWIDGGTGTSLIDYDTAQSQDGSWSFMFDSFTGHTNTADRIYRDLSSASASGYLTFYVRVNVDDRDTPVIRIRSTTGNNIPIEFQQTSTGTGRNIKICATTYSGVMAKDTWYKIGIDYDCTTDTLDFYIDDVKKNGSAISFTAAASTLNRFWFENNPASGFSSTLGNMFWIDDIKENVVASTAYNATRRLHMMSM